MTRDKSNCSSTYVVITRPLPQALNLQKQLADRGWPSLLCPTIDIVSQTPLLDPCEILTKSWYAAIFTSVPAVIHASHWLHQANFQTLSAQYYLAIGKSTQAKLAEYGAQPIVTGETANSESLLLHPCLSSPKQQPILLFKGEAGRDQLEKTLIARGAQVQVANVYRRDLAEMSKDLLQLNHLLYLKTSGKQLVLFASSVSSLIYLVERVPVHLHPALFQLPVVSASARIASAAKGLGFNQTECIAHSAEDEAMITAMEHMVF